MKILVIDPWCSDKYEVYTIGFCEGLSNKVDLTLCSSYHENRKTDKYKIVPLFFRMSDCMKRSKFRTIIRGLEYVTSYMKICGMLKKQKFDVVHVEWALIHKIDIFFLKKMRKMGVKKLVYTSHNVIPHVNGEQHVEELRELHKYFDNILVHGIDIKKEYLSYFPEDRDKLCIQYHGVHFTQQTEYSISNVSEDLINFIKKCDGRLCIFVGNIFFNKGTDRVINYWLENENNSGNRLLIAGAYTNAYKELEDQKEIIEQKDNILFVPRFLNDDEFAYVVSKSQIVTIPYRHASMSGIVYSAAAFSKTIVYTDTGAISEYVGPNCGFVSENNDASYNEILSHVMKLPEQELEETGKKLHDWIYTNYDWNVITEKLKREVYER